MFCKYCGKQIDDDSSYCKYCGRNLLESDTKNHSVSGGGIKEKFTLLPRSYQISILLYIVWLLGWLCVLIGNSDDNHFSERIVLPFFLFTVLIPFAIVSLVYIHNLYKRNKITQYNNIKSNTEVEVTEDSHLGLKKVITKKNVLSGKDSIKEILYTTFSDVWEFNEFLNINGPKLEKVWHKNTRTNDEYCTLNVTNLSGTPISIRFHPTLGELSTTDIKERKDQLFVVKRKDNGEYYLIDNNYEEWYEHLI